MASASWKLCSMSGAQTPSASFSSGLSSPSPSSSLPPLGEGAVAHSADVVGRHKGGHRAGGSWLGVGVVMKMGQGRRCRKATCLYNRCDDDDDDDLAMPQQSYRSRWKTN